MTNEDKNKRAIRDHWNQTSAEYQQTHRIPTNDIHYGIPGATEDRLNLLGDVAGLHIIELGCGGGQNAIALAKRGATCTGVDLSDAQISFAQSLAKEEDVSVEFIVEDIEDLGDLPSNAFDIVLGSAYAFSWVRDLSRAYRASFRILRPGGLFVMSTGHPFTKCFDENHPESLIVRQSYFTRQVTEIEPHSNIEITYLEATLGDLLNPLISAGFHLERVIEPEMKREETHNEGDDWSGGLCAPAISHQIPLIIIIVARAVK